LLEDSDFDLAIISDASSKDSHLSWIRTTFQADHDEIESKAAQGDEMFV
jgi:hypothetical protein